MQDDSDDALESNFRDQITTIARAATSLVPLVGGVLGELIGTIIPSQRMDRVVEYIRQLDRRLEAVRFDVQQLKEDPEKVDMVEEGAFQSARATTTERIDKIVSMVFHALTADESEKVRRKRLVSLLGEIDDDEIALLNAYGQAYGGDDAGEAWERVNRPAMTDMESSRAEIDAKHLYEAGKAQLMRLGLLQKRYHRPRRGEQPTFDPRTGEFKHSIEISYLGRMLLAAIGMETPFDAETSDLPGGDI